MKELSIEEKAKRYDEALNRAKKELDACGSQDCDAARQIFRFFPELKESEDERIRKALINGFNKLDKSAVWYNGITNGQILAWLEKQRQRPDDIDIKYLRMKETKPANIAEFLDRLTTVEQEFLWEHIAKIRELDKEEQKPADKVEPKFKKGDWIGFNGLTLYVKEVVKGFYRTVSKGGIPNSYDWDIDKVARLWTIQDAKDGDVLVDEDNNIGIYKEIKGLCWHSYIYLGYNNCLYGFGIGGSHMQNNTKPATKEQRDQLKKAMADAGYTFEKKELKKIEQKPAFEESKL